MNTTYEIVSGFRRVEEAEAYARSEVAKGRSAHAMIEADTKHPVVIVSSGAPKLCCSEAHDPNCSRYLGGSN